MQSRTRNVFDTIANLGFLVLFPGFVVYHFVVSVGLTAPVLGGLFGGASAAFAVFAVVQLAVQLRSQTGDISLLQRLFVLFCGYFLAWVLIASAFNNHRFSVMAAMMESLGTLII